MYYNTATPEDTMLLGERFGTTLHGGDIVLLSGELGSGKTTFVKGIAHGLNISEDITSPTFTLMNLYKTPSVTLCHIDTYRLRSEDELRAIGVEDYLGQPDVITVIEWPEKLHMLLKGKKTITTVFKHTKDGQRSITFN